jgi:DNA-binding transcriptional regulator GbsR (MarR family)
MKLTDAPRRFIVQWGELGSNWGINRTVAQIHALLFVSAEPLNAEQISETLEVARSNVSSSLKELQSWGIVRRIHRLGDRRDHFEAMTDVWEMARLIGQERKRREIDPTLAALRSCIAQSESDRDALLRGRLSDLLELLEIAATLCDRLNRLPIAALKKSARAGDRLLRGLGLNAGRKAEDRKAGPRSDA